ncbi:hypothetical protein F5Y04DRAFT_245231 [Hypomontagnella monticulosa]|nr:hypothetical protein F5Y04DRAFT_245231 [Hypomontagnella monticulosa]
MDRERARKLSIEIPIHLKPPPYRPGDGPPLAPIGITPEHDSDAFIIDKRVLPSITPQGELKLLMYYVVGWPDLPAARITVLATKAYEYVSARTVEDFEYKDLLEREAEIERQEAEKRRKAEIAMKKKMMKPTSATDTPTIPGTPTSFGQKRRGRPSKAELQARRLARQAGIDPSQSTEAALPSTTISGPSLSTPQKKGARVIPTDVEEDEEAELDDAIYQQLYGDEGAAEDMDIDDLMEDGDIPPDNGRKSKSSGLEIRSYARTLWPNQDSTLVNRANGSFAPKSSTSHVPIPKVLKSNKQFPPPPRQADGRPYVTPVPAPRPLYHVEKKPKPIKSDKRQSTTQVPVPTPFRSTKEFPKPKAFDGRHSTTPVPVPSWPQPPAPRAAQSASVPPPELSRSSPRHHGFTPAGRSSSQWPSAPRRSPRDSVPRFSSPHSQSNFSESEHPSSSRPKKTPKPKPKSKSEPQADEAQVYEVKRLEGDKILTINGVPSRFFKVRWEGNWPASQNPTWEPEDNIPPKLVKHYLKKKAARRKSATAGTGDSNYYGDGSAGDRSNDTPGKASSRHPLTLKRKYSSVAEAVAGGEEDLERLRDEAAGWDRDRFADRGGAEDRYEGEDEGDDDEEEMLVVDTSPNARGSKRAHELGAAFMRDLAAAIHPANMKGCP